MLKNSAKFIPALSFAWLTPLYDLIMQLTMRETTFKRRLVEQMGLKRGHRVLDLGCGTATLTILIKRTYPEAEVVGLDIDSNILKRAREKVAQSGLRITLEQGSALELPYPDNSFDRVVSSLVFHHLARENKARAFREIFRVLRPGGELHAADFGKPHNALMWIISLILRWFEEVSDNIKGLLPQMFREAGFGQVTETARYATAFGTLYLYRVCKPGEHLYRASPI